MTGQAVGFRHPRRLSSGARAAPLLAGETKHLCRCGATPGAPGAIRRRHPGRLPT